MERNCSASHAGSACRGEALAINSASGVDRAAGTQDCMSVQSPEDHGNEHSVRPGASLSAAVPADMSGMFDIGMFDIRMPAMSWPPMLAMCACVSPVSHAKPLAPAHEARSAK